MRSGIKAFLAFAVLAASAAAPRAALDIEAAAPKAAGLQLIVMEAPGCAYCDLFRRDVLPSFAASERAKNLPVRFLDVNDLELANLDLQTDIEIVPTFVLVRNNKEVGRIPGYVAPATFFRSISHLLSMLP